MDNIRVYISNQFEGRVERIQYLCEYLNGHPYKPMNLHISLKSSKDLLPDQIQIQYGQHIYRTPCTLGLFHEKRMATHHWKLYTFTFREMTLFGMASRPEEQGRGAVLLSDGNYAFDFFGNLFFHLSRYEEVFWEGEEALHGGMPEQLQLLVREKKQEIPVVDQLVHFFFQSLEIPISISKTKIRLTHDIDAIWKYPSWQKSLRTLGRALFRQTSRFPTHLQQWYRVWTNKELDPFQTFDWLFTDALIEKEVYWLVGGATRYEGFYDFAQPEIRQLVQLAQDRGYAIGLHPSYQSAIDPGIFQKEAETFRRYAGYAPTHSRQHFLRWDHHQTPHLIERAGIRQDSSIGFNDHIGFRAGTGFPYPLYSFAEERPYRFQTYPMVIMDTALLYRYEDHWAETLQHFLQSNAQQTCITINIHNFTFDPLREGGAWTKAIYQRFFQ